MKTPSILNNTKGAVAPLVAIMLIVIIVCVALVVDLGHVHNVKVQLQRAVDAAALAGAHELTDDVLAATAATGVVRANSVDNQAIGDEIDLFRVTVTLDFGLWDDSDAALGQPASVRYNSVGIPAGETPNAIKVTATRNVDHVFFWFLENTPVTVDAIAVNKIHPLTIPISVVTCIPTGGGTFPGVFAPGGTICDIALFKFGSAPTDTAGWTSLTVPNTSNPTVSDFFNDCGIDLFNRIVFGGDDEESGLENTVNISRSLGGGIGCPIESNETDIKGFPDYCSVPVNISCGLGGDYADGHDNPVDPRLFTPLPHWYDDDGSALERIWSQDGTLSPGPLATGEVDADGVPTAAYFNRLKDLYLASQDNTFDDPGGYNETYTGIGKALPAGFPRDERFTRYINQHSGEPSFRLPLQEAGYPEVSLIEGKTAVVKAMIDMVADEDTLEFKEDFRKENEPLDNKGTSGGKGETVIITIPIIYTGSCTDTQYNKTGIYVGTANLLLTRLWETKQATHSFDAGFNSVSVTANWDTFCNSATLFGKNKKINRLPPLTGLQLSSVLGFDGKSFEGLLLEPDRGPEADTGIRKIYLVE